MTTTAPGDADSGALSFHVLGPFEVRRDGVALALGPPKQRAVLACLALARGQVVSTDRLLEVVWGEELPPNAVGNLHAYVSRLRALLRDGSGVSPLMRQAPGYLLTTTPGQFDVDRFLDLAELVRAAVDSSDWATVLAAATEAGGLWRGEVISDLAPSSRIRGQADAWEDRRWDVAGARVVALLGLRRPQEATAASRALVEAGAYRDDATRLLMISLHQTGRTPAALAAFTDHVRRLDEELGIEPSSSLRALHVALLRQDDWVARWPGQVAHGSADQQAGAPPRQPGTEPEAGGAAPVRPMTTSEDPARPPREFVGRVPEWSEVLRSVEEVTADPGGSRVLVLSGPAGIGKTRLAEEVLAAVVARGGAVVRGRCLAEDGAPVWWPLRQVARELGVEPDEVLTAPAQAGADALRFTVYERIRRLLVERSGPKPLAMLIDDLQWADSNSAGALAYLATALGPSRVLLVATVRDDARDLGALRPAAQMLRAQGSRHIVVPPLTPAETVELAKRTAGDEMDARQAASLVEFTAGNALFVTEYARLPPSLRASGEIPLAVRGVLAQRLDALGAEVLVVLRVAAVLGDSIDVALLARASALERSRLFDLLDLAADAAIIEPRRGGSGYGFAHGLLREQVLAGLAPLRRQQLHAQVAAALTTLGGERLALRAQHLLAAGPLAEPREVSDACRAAARQAEQRMSAETAAGWWRAAHEALDVMAEEGRDPQERDDLVVAEVEALVRSGRGQSALDRIEAELGDAVRTGRTGTSERLAATLLRVSGTWPWAAFGQDPGPLVERLQAVEAAVAENGPARARVLAALAVGRCYDPDPDVPDRLSRAALDVAEATGDPDVIADALIGRVSTYVGEAVHAEEAELLLDRLVALPRAGSEALAEADAVFAHSARTMSMLLLADVPALERHLRAGIAGADRLRLRDVRAQLRWMEVGLHHWQHGAESALDRHAEALEMHRGTELYDGGFADLVRQVLLFSLGRLGEVDVLAGFEERLWRAARAAQFGDRHEAVALLRERVSAPYPPAWSTLAHLLVTAELVSDLQVEDLAPPILELLEPHAGRLASLGQGPFLGPVDAYRARLMALTGQRELASEALERARDVCRRNGGRLWAERCERLSRELGRGSKPRP